MPDCTAFRAPVAKARIEKELARLGLAERAHDKAAQLSGGNRRRLELARALLHEPRVLLMDEATVGLDPGSRSELLKLIIGLRAERGVAVLWATHLCDEVPNADRVVVLDHGKVLADTTPAELVAKAGTATIEQAFLAMTGGADAAIERQPMTNFTPAACRWRPTPRRRDRASR